MPAGQISLRRIAEHTTALDVVCNRCPRTTRLILENLVREFGARSGIADVLDTLFPDCPNRDAPIYTGMQQGRARATQVVRANSGSRHQTGRIAW
jgi:hypothetical protein